MKVTFGRRWHVALTGAVGKVGFDYLALVCCLAAVGARPDPSLVLLAYVAGALLALIPITPGGLGFVEAGLTGMLTAAGVGAQEALVSTLAYRARLVLAAAARGRDRLPAVPPALRRGVRGELDLDTVP